MDAKFKIGDAITFTDSEEDKYGYGDTGRIVSAEDLDGRWIYTVNSAGVDIQSVAEDKLQFALGSTERDVDNILREAEKDKEFRDSDIRVGGTRKEMMAFKGLMTLKDMDDLEKDSVMAKSLIKKAKVYPKFDIESEIDKGASGGAAYMKYELRRACAADVKGDSADLRKLYVGLIEYIVTGLDEVLTVKSFTTTGLELVRGVLRKSMLILNPDIEPLLVAQKEGMEKLVEREGDMHDNAINLKHKLRELSSRWNDKAWEEEQPELYKEWKEADRIYREVSNYRSSGTLPLEMEFVTILVNKRVSPSYFNSEILETILGKRFYYLLSGVSTRSYAKKLGEIRDAAESYEALTEEESLIGMEEAGIKKMYERAAKYEKHIAELTDENKSLKEKIDYALEQAAMGDWGYIRGRRRITLQTLTNTGELKEAEDMIDRIVRNQFAGKASAYKREAEEIKERFKVRENDYSWAEKKAKAKKKKSSELVINSGVPLSYIKRISGVAVYDNDLDTGDKVLSFYKDILNVTGVTYGKTMPDAERMPHVKHFASAILDLAEAINFDVKEMMEGFGIKFAASGRGRAMAHFEPNRNAINLTRKKGDGTVAHEMAHYLDRKFYLDSPSPDAVKMGKHAEYSSYSDISRNWGKNVANEDVSKAFDYIMSFIHNGVPVFQEKEEVDGVWVNKYAYDADKTDTELSKTLTPLFEKMVTETFDKKILIKFQASKDTKYNPNDSKSLEEALEVMREHNPNFFEYTTIYPDKGDRYAAKYGKRVREYFEGLALHYGKDEIEVEFNNTPKKPHGTWGSEYTGTHFFTNSKHMRSNYWIYDWELFARAFETYTYDKLVNQGRFNNYLVSGAHFEVDVYPQGIEREILYVLYEHLFRTTKKEFEISDFTAFRDERVDEHIELETGDKEKRTLVTDAETHDVVQTSSEDVAKKAEATEILQGLIDIMIESTKMQSGGLVNTNLISELSKFAKLTV